jgi:membrane fusion protein (multidrug efflux system)
MGVLLAGTACKPEATSGSGSGSGGGAPAVQVVAVPVRREPVLETVPLVGSIAPNEMVVIRSETEGLVETIHFEEGDRVSAGQLLISLDSTKLAASLAEAEANLQLSQTNYERARELLRDRLISQQDFDQEAAFLASSEAGVNLRRRLQRDTRIQAPFAGILGERRVSPGQVIDRNSIITSLVDLDRVRVDIQVPERYLSQIKVGQTIRFQVDAYPQTPFEGEVYFISPQLESTTRTAQIKAMVANPELRLRSGMFAKLELTVQLRDNALVVPEPALVSDGDRFQVFVVDAEKQVRLKTVRVGLRMAGKAEILEGLSEGDEVVVEGTQKIYPDAVVRLAGEDRMRPYLP